jgi:hypothetical protein
LYLTSECISNLNSVTSTKAFLKGVETWKKETVIKRVILFLDSFHYIILTVCILIRMLIGSLFGHSFQESAAKEAEDSTSKETVYTPPPTQQDSASETKTPSDEAVN